MIITQKQQLGADRVDKTVCEQKQCCGKCGAFITEKNMTVTNATARIVVKTKRSDTYVSRDLC